MKKARGSSKAAAQRRPTAAAKTARPSKSPRRTVAPAGESTGVILRSAVSDLAMITGELRELVFEMRAMMRRDAEITEEEVTMVVEEPEDLE